MVVFLANSQWLTAKSGHEGAMKPDNADSAANAPVPPKMWRGLDELAGEPGYAEAALNEFPEGASEFTDEPSRRRFLALMGASLALAGATGCNLRPAAQRKIVPYTTQPDEITPGVPLFFASAAAHAGYGQGVLVRSSEGRPTKIEGNPDHPSSLGGSGVFAQASVLDLYDPDRSRGVTRHGAPSSYELAVAALREKIYDPKVYDAATGKSKLQLRIVTETITSPTLAGQLAQLLAACPNAKWVRFDAISNESARAGVAKAFGKPVNVTYDFLKADVVVAIDSDFLCTGPGSVRYSRDFADRRKIRADGKDAAAIAAGRTPGKSFKEGVKADQLNRLYAVETMPTNTGAVAEHRLALSGAQVANFTRTLAAALGVGGVTGAGEWSGDQQKWVTELANDLKAKKGKSVVIAGEHLPAWVHALVAAINTQLENNGKTIHLTGTVEAEAAGRMSDLKTLTDELKAKTVDALVVLGGANPAYSAPADIDFAGVFRKNAEEKAELSKKATRSAEEQKALDYLNSFFTFHLGSHQDETAVLCEWHVNEAHYLETWGDIRGHDGTVAIQQPLIAPLHGGRSVLEVIAAVVRPAESGVPSASRDPLEIVKATWKDWFEKAKKPGYFEIFWQESVRKGVIEGTAAPAEAANLAADATKDLPAPAAGADYEVNFRACPALFDGRYANNGWLQELPKPLTKISWDNAAFISPETARKLNVPKTNFRWTAGEHGRAEVSVIELDVGGKKVRAPVWVLPGHANGSITVYLGHGRDRAGRVAALSDYLRTEEKNPEGKPVHGFNAYPLRTSAAPWSAPVKVTVTNKTYFLACTQGHWSMAQKDPISGKELDRKPVRRATLDEYKSNPLFAKVTPMAAKETELINENVPLPKKAHHGGSEGHGEGEHNHDERLKPLNMYNPAEGLVPGLREFQRRRWALAIDLNVCNGCSACVVACQSENNTPVVGKEQVTKAREMYWISIDRYYEGAEGDSNALKTYFQPRMCVQCENAPCEVVCPVGATAHSADGLNDMTYNRCVGTRYCSNNCPYKVRRFNFLTLQDWETDTIKLGRNPDVSVRSRGVMEKCTFCVQRIRGAEIVAERELAQGLRKEPDPEKGETLIKDGEILTACQSACPSGAIVFGDINDPHATVSRWKNEPTNYGLLAELNTRPRLTHMAVVRNPNPNLK
jgi:molybdopterin-containing oxidoreductase family iron-sulfur binding subunit